MNTYTVHEQPDPPADRLDRAEALVFVRDGFSLSAALFAPVWLLSKRLWLPLLAYLAFLAAILAGSYVVGLAPGWTSLAVWTLHALVGFEADTLERLQLATRGYTTVGTVGGRNRDQCERRFLDDWLPAQPMIAPTASTSAGTLAATAPAMAPSAPTVVTPSAGGWRGLLRRRTR